MKEKYFEFKKKDEKGKILKSREQVTTAGQAALRLSEDVQELRNDINLLSNQLNELTARFNSGSVGNYEPQKIFKVKGTFVGHQGQVWCLAVAGDILFRF